MSRDAEKLIEAMSKAGYRITQPRRIIVSVLVETGAHISADTLVDLVREKDHSIGRTTIYRTLDLLGELGFVNAVYQGTGAAHYVLMKSDGHHYLICDRCHDVVEFNECLGGDMVEDICQRFGFSLRNHLLEIHGICRNCS
ncbi:MAG: transcriptional repressor [Chloroflexi bacterium]|nr:transcriptional repressor [Chloroflexota bacterium]